MRQPPLFLFARAAIVVAIMCADASAQSSLPLQIEVEFPSNVSRTCGPIRLQLIMNWGGPGVLHGALELEARDSTNDLIATYVLDNLYLTQGEQSQEVMLPGFRVGALDDAFTLRARVFSRDSSREWRLNDLQIQVPSNDQRELVIAMLVPEGLRQTRRENDIADSLRLEQLAPPILTRPKILTKATDWRAEDAPQDPLRYCACDIVLLPDDGLALLQPPQLEALLGWIRAGGGICVMLEEAELGGPQVAFLNSLVGASADAPTFLRTTAGRLVHELDESAGVALQRKLGLGRIVIVTGPEQSHPRAAHWIHTAAFLWRLRQAHLPSVARNGCWDQDYALGVAKKSLEQTRSGAGYSSLDGAQFAQATDFQAMPTYGLTDLILGLLPDGVRLVPLSTMCLWLGFYLVMIGPVDYFVLGWLGKRRWTWITFPTMTLLFTGISIAVSNSSMGASIMSRSAILRDMAAGGALVRENRFELLFPSRTRPVTTESDRGLMMPLRYQDFAQFNNYYMFYDPNSIQALQRQRTQPALFHGRMPSQCAMTQGISQWTPQLNRLLTIPVEQPPDLPKFDWDEVPDFKSQAGLEKLRARIDAAFGISVQDRLRLGLTTSVSAGVFHRESATVLQGDAALFNTHDSQPVLVNTPYGQEYRTQVDSYLRLLSVGSQPGFLGVVSEYAPTGGDRFEDLCVLDPTDSRQWLLVIVQPHGHDFHIYRRLYVLEN